MQANIMHHGQTKECLTLYAARAANRVSPLQIVSIVELSSCLGSKSLIKFSTLKYYSSMADPDFLRGLARRQFFLKSDDLFLLFRFQVSDYLIPLSWTEESDGLLLTHFLPSQ